MQYAVMQCRIFILPGLREATVKLLLQALINRILYNQVMMLIWQNSIVPAVFHGLPTMGLMLTGEEDKAFALMHFRIFILQVLLIVRVVWPLPMHIRPLMPVMIMLFLQNSVLR